ncbi:oxidoreductase [Planobispora takensis]|uniref:Oxidoreductase n=1 Tax=Planobispora takensis TaxID=1367882 RepID=A0A8J3SVY0_9ACTN|nr:oxidoreductase [Planobispora takensis]GII00320.1 oxidoreductase [Planobispora takensis]
MWKIPDLTGSTALVTGASSGIGIPTVRVLAARGARVIMTARDLEKGRAAAGEITARVPGARIELRRLDLADLSSVRAFAAEVDEPVDLLINNAGIGLIPRQTTADGFEMQFGTNHLGHFALTGLLLPRLLARPGARVVTVSSDAHAVGRIDFDDLTLERGYSRFSSYGRSKLANLMFARELQRRAQGRLISVAVHPGTTMTGIVKFGPLTRPIAALGRLLIQTPDKGAIPTLYAATSPDVHGGEFIGPGPKELQPKPHALDEEVTRRLWEESEKLTGVRFEMLDRHQ